MRRVMNDKMIAFQDWLESSLDTKFQTRLQ
eukprot:SAG11_NODE_37552_length_256_cov_0.980892_2_plen_29_part_01